MKNNTILVFLLLAASFRLTAQDSKFRLGIRFAPCIATNRIVDVKEDDGVKFETDGIGLRFSGGLTGDFYFGKNYSFYTGLWYSVQKAGVKFTGPEGVSGKAVHNLQYVQIPLAIKLFTNEIATDTKLYFVLGGTAGIRINEKEKEWSTSGAFSKPGVGNSYSYFDAGLLLGAGAEMQLGENTTLFGGISYNRGLLDIASKKGPFNDKASDQFTLSASAISLEVGIKF
jgi:hypothetical protein